MNRVLRRAISLALLLTTIPHFAYAGEIMTKDEKNVLAAVQTMTSAFQEGNIDAVMSSYESTATVVFEPGSPISNTEQIREMFIGMAAVNPVFEYTGHDVVITGDVGVHIAPWSMKGRSPDGEVIEQSGLSVAVLRRQGDGSWKMIIDNPHGSALMANEK